MNSPIMSSAGHLPNATSVSMRLGRLQFHRSGKFRVLQVADIQEGVKVSADMIHLLQKACDEARPDLVIFTGNQIKGYDKAFAPTFRNRRWASGWNSAYSATVQVAGGAADTLKKVMAGNQPEAAGASRLPVDPLEHTRKLVREQAEQFLKPLIERHIPFAITYGNHDFQCGLSTAELDAIYRQFPGCLNPEAGEKCGVAISGQYVPASGMSRQVAYGVEPGTFALPVWDLPNNTAEDLSVRVARAVYHGAIPSQAETQQAQENKDDAPALNLVVLNSGDYAREGGYGTPSGRALEWLRQLPQIISTDQSAASAIPAALFQHFPLPQYYDLLLRVEPTHDGAIQGYRTHGQNCYVLNPELVEEGSKLGEGISCPDEDCGEYDILRATHVGAIFTGHDHRNAFVGRLPKSSVKMCATPTSGFGSYGPPAAERAIRLVEFDIRHPEAPRTQLLYFADIVGETPGSRSVYTFVNSHVPVNVAQTKDALRKSGKVAKKAAGVAAGLALLAGALTAVGARLRGKK